MQKTATQIVEATTDAEILAAFPIMQELRPNLLQEDFVARVRRQEAAGYRLVNLRLDGEVKAVMGFRLTENLSSGEHVYIDDLVSTAEARSSGLGAQLLDWMAEWARQRGCSTLHLDSGVQRAAAHRFYFREGMSIVYYHFLKKL